MKVPKGSISRPEEPSFQRHTFVYIWNVVTAAGETWSSFEYNMYRQKPLVRIESRAHPFRPVPRSDVDQMPIFYSHWSKKYFCKMDALTLLSAAAWFISESFAVRRFNAAEMHHAQVGSLLASHLACYSMASPGTPSVLRYSTYSQLDLLHGLSLAAGIPNRKCWKPHKVHYNIYNYSYSEHASDSHVVH